MSTYKKSNKSYYQRNKPRLNAHMAEYQRNRTKKIIDLTNKLELKDKYIHKLLDEINSLKFR